MLAPVEPKEGPACPQLSVSVLNLFPSVLCSFLFRIYCIFALYSIPGPLLSLLHSTLFYSIFIPLCSIKSPSATPALVVRPTKLTSQQTACSSPLERHPRCSA